MPRWCMLPMLVQMTCIAKMQKCNKSCQHARPHKFTYQTRYFLDMWLRRICGIQTNSLLTFSVTAPTSLEIGTEDLYMMKLNKNRSLTLLVIAIQAIPKTNQAIRHQCFIEKRLKEFL